MPYSNVSEWITFPDTQPDSYAPEVSGPYFPFPDTLDLTADTSLDDVLAGDYYDLSASSTLDSILGDPKATLPGLGLSSETTDEQLFQAAEAAFPSRTISTMSEIKAEDPLSPIISPSPSVCSSSRKRQMEDSPPATPATKHSSPRTSTSSRHTSPAKNSSKMAKRIPHNQIEKKYRETLNTALERLRRAVPAVAGEHGDSEAPKISKAIVLSSALEYVRQLEKEQTRLNEENRRLRIETIRRGRVQEEMQKRMIILQAQAQSGLLYSRPC